MKNYWYDKGKTKDYINKLNFYLGDPSNFARAEEFGADVSVDDYVSDLFDYLDGVYSIADEKRLLIEWSDLFSMLIACLAVEKLDAAKAFAEAIEEEFIDLTQDQIKDLVRFYSVENKPTIVSALYRYNKNKDEL